MAVTLAISITQNSQSITNNSTNVTVKVNASWTGGSWSQIIQPGWLKIDGKTFDFETSFNYNKTTSGSQTLFTKTVNVYHNADGTKTLACSASYRTGGDSGTIGASVPNYELPTIPRKSTLSVANGALGTSQTLTVTRQANIFRHSIRATCGSSKFYINADGTTTTTETLHTDCSIPFVPPLDWARQNTTGTSVSVTYLLTTYDDDANYVDEVSYPKTYTIPESVRPSCKISVTDATQYNYLKGLSKLKITITPTTAYGSEIKSYSTTVDGKTYTASSFTTDVISSDGTLKISATVKDKRERSSTATTADVVIRDYFSPNISSLSVHRCNADGTANDDGNYVKVVFGASVSSVASASNIKYYLEYKKTSDKTYTEKDLTSAITNKHSVSDYSDIFEADNGSSYDVRVSVVDGIYDRVYRTTSASTGFTTMHFPSSGKGMGIGKVAELDNVLDVGFQTRLYGGLLYRNLEYGADLNELTTPNFYSGFDVANKDYQNCPLSDGSFTLIVAAAGGSGQARQFIAECDKTHREKYERYLYPSSGWGEWIKLSPTSLKETILYTPTAANTYEYVGSVTIPAYKFYTITARGMYNKNTCKGVILSEKSGESATNYKHSYAAGLNEDTAVHYPSCTYSGYTGEASKTFYIWGKWAGTNQNSVQITGFYLPY